jgi:hypothetical protein
LYDRLVHLLDRNCPRERRQQRDDHFAEFDRHDDLLCAGAEQYDRLRIGIPDGGDGDGECYPQCANYGG